MLSIKRRIYGLTVGIPLIVAGLLLGIGLALTVPPLAYGQGGPYRLVIEGQVYREQMGPAMNTPVLLTTSLGETLKTKTDGNGFFTLTGEVMADGGSLEVRSGAVSTVSFGQMSVTWAAGGPGDKFLTVNLLTDGDTLWSDATEPPYPAPLPGEEEPPTPTPWGLPTTAPTPAPTPVLAGGDAAPTPPVNEAADSLGWSGVVLLGLIGLGAVGLLGAGLVLLISERRRSRQ